MPRKGYKQSEEHKKKISIAIVGKHHSEETKANLSKYFKGRPNPKLSETMKNKYENRYTSRGMLGKHHTQESKNKTSKSLKGKIKTEETKAKMRIARSLRVIPFKDTSIEVKIQNGLTEKGILFEKHKALPGQPDVFIKPNICVFADGCFWHRCTKCGHGPEREHDKRITDKLQKQGFVVLRFWEHDINSRLEWVIETIVMEANRSK